MFIHRYFPCLSGLGLVFLHLGTWERLRRILVLPKRQQPLLSVVTNFVILELGLGV